MFTWGKHQKVGKARLRRRAAAADTPKRDLLARSSDRARAGRSRLSADDRRAERARRRRRSACAVAGRSGCRKPCSRERTRRRWVSGSRASSSAKRFEQRQYGKGRFAISACRSTCFRPTSGAPGYDRWLLDEVEAVGIDPKRITLEITESVLVADQETSRCDWRPLRRAGISIAVDDFGTGYSSLAYLTRLPLDMIKIDRGLIADIVSGEHDQIVVKALIRLARELGLQGRRRGCRNGRAARAAEGMGLRPIPGIPRRGAAW